MKVTPDAGAYLPSQEEIARLKIQMREEGWRDAEGNWHPPWRDKPTKHHERVGRPRKDES